MRLFKAGTAVRTPEDEIAFARLAAIANRLKPQDSSYIEIDSIPDESPTKQPRPGDGSPN